MNINDAYDAYDSDDDQPPDPYVCKVCDKHHIGANCWSTESDEDIQSGLLDAMRKVVPKSEAGTAAGSRVRVPRPHRQPLWDPEFGVTFMSHDAEIASTAHNRDPNNGSMASGGYLNAGNTAVALALLGMVGLLAGVVMWLGLR